MGARWSAVVVFTAIPAAVLVLDPGGWFPFGPSKLLATSVLLVAGAAALFWQGPVRIVRVPTIAALALVAWLAIAAWFGVDRLSAFAGTADRRFGVVTWCLCALALVVGQSVDVRRQRAVIVGAFVVAGFGVGALAIAEAAGWRPSWLGVTAGRLSGSMGSAAFLGAVTVLLLPALIGFALERELPVRLRGTAASAALGVAVACVGAGARAAWFGLVVAGLAVVAVRRRTLFAHRRRAVVVGVVGALALVVVVLLSPAGGRLRAVGDADAAGGRSRVDEWRVAGAVLAHHPVLGVGPEGYRIAFAEGVTDDYEQAHGRDPLPDRAHDVLLDVGVTGGLPAVLAWVVAMGAIVVACIRVLRGGARWLAGIAAAFVAHVAEQALLFPTSELEPVAWLLAGVVVGSAARAGGSPEPPKTSDAARPHDETAARVHERLVPRPCVVVLAAVAVLAAILGVSDVVADHEASHAVAASARGDHDDAVRAAQRAVDLRPDEVRLHVLLAQQLVAADRGTTAALAALDDGLVRSPRDPIAVRYRAQLLVQRAAATHLPVDVEAAHRDVDALLAADGSSSALWLLAGTVARLDGDATGAETAFRRAEELTPHDATASVELALLYLDTGRVEDARAAAARAVAREPDDPQARAVQGRAAGAG